MDPNEALLTFLVDDWLALTAVRDTWANDEVRDRLLDIRNTLPRPEPVGV